MTLCFVEEGKTLTLKKGKTHFFNLKMSPLEILDKSFQGICPNVKSRIDIVQGISKAYLNYCWWDKLPNAEILKSDK